jgi:uncharacterized membrane protein YgdD (TMEM256/DUF423 family)
MTEGRTAALATVSAAIAVGAAAFGAHAANSAKAAEWLQTGGHYQLAHAIGALVLIRWPAMTRPAQILIAGSVIFAATLYAMAVGAPRWFGAITPIGGALMMAGWLWAAWRFWRE